MDGLADRLLETIRKQKSIRAGDRLAVAVSGGADSVALLRLLLELRPELGIVLSVAHVNHKLRGEESDEDARFVAQLAAQYGLEIRVFEAPTQPGKGSGIEAAARELRYTFFCQLAREGSVSKIATAHTLEDQAETVLLRMFRGTGIRGLAGIHPQIVFEEDGKVLGEVIRPLLGIRRAELREFLREKDQNWREDSSNLDIAFLRNRVRHRLLPVITDEFGEAAIEHMSELAEIARAEEDHWKHEHPEVWPQGGGDTRQAASLQINILSELSLAAQRRLVRDWLEMNAPGLGISARLIADVLDLSRGEAGRRLELSGEYRLRRERAELLLERGTAEEDEFADYEYVLSVPGVVEIPELRTRVEASVVNPDVVPDSQRGQLLYLGRMPKQVVIRNWRAGDRFWPAHTAEESKVKELLSDRQVTGAEKKLWPVAIAEGCGLVWMRGFAVPAIFRAPAGTPKAIWIREI